MKRCSKCRTGKPLSEYHKARHRKDGRYHMCKVCRKAYSATRFQKKKKKYAKWKRERKARLVELIRSLRDRCVRCDESHQACLVFHHRNPAQKEFTIAYAAAQGWSEQKIREEIDKCDVLCANCHRKEHWRLRHGPQH